MSDELIPIDCAVNDRHGNTTEKVEAIHVPGLELDAIDIFGVHFRQVYSTGKVLTGFYLSRRKWPARHLASCVGNVFWERYGLEPKVAADFLHYLRETEMFQLDGGFEQFWQWWKSGIVEHGHVERMLVDAAKDDRL